jgi:hypothetical protein
VTLLPRFSTNRRAQFARLDIPELAEDPVAVDLASRPSSGGASCRTDVNQLGPIGRQLKESLVHQLQVEDYPRLHVHVHENTIDGYRGHI